MEIKQQRIAIYVNTEEQSKNSNSVITQLDTLRSYCESHNKKIHKEYIDYKWVNKTVPKYPELEQLLKDVGKNIFDEVWILSITHFIREDIDLVHIIDLLDNHNITLHCLSENVSTNIASEKFSLKMLAIVGQFKKLYA